MRRYRFPAPYAGTPLRTLGVSNRLIRAWASWKAPPLLLIFDVDVRVREIARALLMSSGNATVRSSAPSSRWGAMKHLAADKAKTFQNLRKYLVDPEVVIDEASAAVSALETDKDGIRFDLTTSAIEVVNDTNFFNLDVVANTTPSICRTSWKT